MNLDLPKIKSNFSQKTDEQLLDVLAFAQDDYNPIVVPLIEGILIARGYSSEQIVGINNSYKKLFTMPQIHPLV